jgi:ATP-dependent DNA ligase
MKDVTTLYKTSSTGKLMQWCAYAEGSNLVMEYGQVGGKIQKKVIPCEAKNIGRANATTAEQQAEKEVVAKYEYQLKTGYFEDIEQAKQFRLKKPMRAKDYKDHAGKLRFPCYGSPKLNGFRLAMVEGTSYSKAGIQEDLTGKPEHLVKMFGSLTKISANTDGEIYCHGMSLQDIRSAWLTPKEDSIKLKYYIYDIPADGVPMHGRMRGLKNLESCFEAALSKYPVEFVEQRILRTQAEADAFYQECLAKGYEGVVYRNEDGVYEFDKQSSDMIKRKPRLDAEAKVLSVTKDRIGDGVLLCQMPSGLTFECKMKKPKTKGQQSYRGYDAATTLIGKWINYEYEELSNDGKPTKPVGIYVRDCNDAGEPLV